METENPRLGCKARASLSIAADTVSPTQSPDDEQAKVAPIIASDQTLAFHVKQYVPDAHGAELEHRIALLKARDWAAALRGRTSSWLATECSHHAHDIAGRFVFRLGESNSRLELAVRLCRHLVGAAMAAESLDSEETPL